MSPDKFATLMPMLNRRFNCFLLVDVLFFRMGSAMMILLREEDENVEVARSQAPVGKAECKCSMSDVRGLMSTKRPSWCVSCSVMLVVGPAVRCEPLPRRPKVYSA